MTLSTTWLKTASIKAIVTVKNAVNNTTAKVNLSDSLRFGHFTFLISRQESLKYFGIQERDLPKKAPTLLLGSGTGTLTSLLKAFLVRLAAFLAVFLTTLVTTFLQIKKA